MQNIMLIYFSNTMVFYTSMSDGNHLTFTVWQISLKSAFRYLTVKMKAIHKRKNCFIIVQ